MPSKRVIVDGKEVEISYGIPPRIPLAWVEIVNKLNPVTAVVVWQVLTDSLSPETITLAQSSPDWHHYKAIRIVGGGNPNCCKEVAELARAQMEEIYRDLLPGWPTQPPANGYDGEENRE